MYDTVSFIIPGEPCAKGRPRFNGKTGFAYTPEKTRRYEAFVKLCFRQSRRTFFAEQALEVRILAKFGIPKSASKKRAQAMREGLILPTKRPDLDNVVKIICDSLNGLAYRDDSQVTDLEVHKRYADQPMLLVVIRPASDNGMAQLDAMLPALVAER